MGQVRWTDVSIVIFTLALVMAGLLQWRATSLYARTLISVESPKVFIYSLGFRPHGQRLSGREIVMELTNYGRTPAIVVRACMQLHTGSKLPPKPAYIDVFEMSPGARAILPSDRLSVHSRPLNLTESQIQSIANGQTTLWLYGYIAYLDFLNTEHCMRFCQQWDQSEGRFFWPLDAPPEYTKHTERRPRYKRARFPG